MVLHREKGRLNHNGKRGSRCWSRARPVKIVLRNIEKTQKNRPVGGNTLQQLVMIGSNYSKSSCPSTNKPVGWRLRLRKQADQSALCLAVPEKLTGTHVNEPRRKERKVLRQEYLGGIGGPREKPGEPRKYLRYVSRKTLTKRRHKVCQHCRRNREKKKLEKKTKKKNNKN